MNIGPVNNSVLLFFSGFNFFVVYFKRWSPKGIWSYMVTKLRGSWQAVRVGWVGGSGD